MTATETFAAWALALKPADIPGSVKRAAVMHLLDGIGCGLAAQRLGIAPYAAGSLRMSGPPDASILGRSTFRLPTPAAAFANGVLVHALDFDDTHAAALVHATAAVLPTALAVGQQVEASGAEVLAAAIAGYELVIRLGAAVPHAFHARGLHATSVCGVFASALIAARLTGLGPGTTVSALGIAGSMTAGSLEFLDTGSSTKQLHPGFAAMSGVNAANLAAAGAEGPASILEGRYGLFRGLAGVDVDAAHLTADLGTRWETNAIGFKRYPACQLSHASLDALRSVLGKIDGPIREMVFDVPQSAIPIVCEPREHKRRPRSAYEGKFSLPYCAAVLSCDGRLDVDAFHHGNLERSDILALADLVQHRAAAWDGPPAEAPGRVRITLRNGTAIEGEAPPPSQMTEGEVIDKFVSNVGFGKGPKLADVVFGLEGLASVGALMEAM